MRRLPFGTIVCALLLILTIFLGPLSQPAEAQQELVIGFVVGESRLVVSSAIGQQLGQYFQRRLAIPVRVRSFTAEEQLYNWLSRFREVDVAWLSNKFLQNIPNGQLYLLAKPRGPSYETLKGWFVTRQGVAASKQQQLADILLAMHEDDAVRELLSELGVSQFTGPTSWLSSGLIATSFPDTLVNSTSEQSSSAMVDRKPTVTTDTDKVTVVEPMPERTVKDEISRTTHIEEPAVDNNRKPEGDRVVPPSKSRADDTEVSAATSGEQIELVADSLVYNSSDDSYEAKGDVVLRRSGIELKTSELLWQSATQDASATGNVSLNDAGTSIFGDSMQYNVSTGQGQIHKGRVFVPEGNFHLSGEEIEKTGHADYLVRNGSFTTCDGDIPDWKFTAEEVDVTLGGYAKARNVYFHIKDIPVLYTPYFAFPVKAERESGLLTPWFGYSKNKGLRASLAWYQVVDTNMDATFYLDYLSEVALGKGVEYRYALAAQNNGEALLYHVNGLNDVPDMYYLEWKHRGQLPGDWWLTGDVEYADKQRFFDEMGEVAEEYNRDKTYSTVMLQKNWHKLNLAVHGRYIRDLEDEDNDTVLQRLPEFSLNLTRYRLGKSPVYLGLESYATRFWREEGEDGERLYLRPSVAAVFKPGSWLGITPEVALHGRFYDTDKSDDNEFIPEFNLTLATRLQKVFSFERWGVERLQHSIEPRFTYTYIPDENQGDLPDFDLLDRIEQKNEIEFELVNRLITRNTEGDGARNYRDFFQFRLHQSYDIDEARNNTSGKDQPFSDISAELDFWPTRNLSLEAESLIPVYGSTHFRSAKIGASAKDESGNAVNVSYNYKEEDFANVATDYLSFRLDTSFFKPLYLRFEERYDFRESRDLEGVVGLEYRFKCWSLLLTYRNRYQENGDNDQEVMVNFLLAGVGRNQGFGNGFADD